MKKRLTRFLPETPKTGLTLWIVAREGRRIVCKSCEVTEPVELTCTVQPVPPELLVRAIALNHNKEARRG